MTTEQIIKNAIEQEQGTVTCADYQITNLLKELNTAQNKKEEALKKIKQYERDLNLILQSRPGEQ